MVLVRVLGVKMEGVEGMWEKGNCGREEFRGVRGVGCVVEEHLGISRWSREVDGLMK